MSPLPCKLKINNKLKGRELIVGIEEGGIPDPNPIPLPHGTTEEKSIESYSQMVTVELEKKDIHHSKDFWIEIPEGIRAEFILKTGDEPPYELDKIVFCNKNSLFFRIPQNCVKWRIKYFFKASDYTLSVLEPPVGTDKNVSIGDEEP